MRSRVARATVWVVWARGVLQGISFVSTLVLARLLSPEDFGLFALVAVWTGVIALVAELGLGDTIVQFRNLRDARAQCLLLADDRPLDPRLSRALCVSPRDRDAVCQ
jgi:O-antigen/teichoic acid export membrane protein